MAKTSKTVEVTTQLSEEQLARLNSQSGVATGSGIKLPVLNRISLNGNADAIENEKGELVRPEITFEKHIYVGKEAENRPEKVKLGSPIEVIFVKLRRRLVMRDSQGFQVMSSSQHSSPTDIITLYNDGEMIDKGMAKAIRERYPDLRTIQETYVIMPDGELALLIAKGSSLGSKTRDESKPTFYDYIQELHKTGGIFAHKTILGGALEKGAKQFYTMTFTQGRPTTTEEKLAVLDHSDNLTDLITKYDIENANATLKNADVVVESATVTPEGMNLEDIGF